MGYEDACEARITHAEAMNEIKRHHPGHFTENAEEFHRDIGRRDTYRGREVLDWLGY